MTDELRKEFAELLAALRGKDVLVTGTTVGGDRVENRRLNNVTADLMRVVGWDPLKKQVRQFRTSNLTMIVLAPDQTGKTEKGATEGKDSGRAA